VASSSLEELVERAAQEAMQHDVALLAESVKAEAACSLAAAAPAVSSSAAADTPLPSPEPESEPEPEPVEHGVSQSRVAEQAEELFADPEQPTPPSVVPSGVAVMAGRVAAGPGDVDTTRTTTAAATAEEPLPPSWTLVVDAEGRPFYYHAPSGTSSWARPVPAAALHVPLPAPPASARAASLDSLPSRLADGGAPSGGINNEGGALAPLPLRSAADSSGVPTGAAAAAAAAPPPPVESDGPVSQAAAHPAWGVLARAPPAGRRSGSSAAAAAAATGAPSQSGALALAAGWGPSPSCPPGPRSRSWRPHGEWSPTVISPAAPASRAAGG
jgi:hypothetical protein